MILNVKEKKSLSKSTRLLALENAGMAKIGTGKLPKGFLELPRPKDHKNLAVKALLKEREQSLYISRFNLDREKPEGE